MDNPRLDPAAFDAALADLDSAVIRAKRAIRLADECGFDKLAAKLQADAVDAIMVFMAANDGDRRARVARRYRDLLEADDTADKL
jgi:hypothetical protein